ncbi:MAG: hypothetical protein JW774_05545 [Candidatus Aureabacteria bacterium]|nr:hypothetical protein [Candidatus Auribacterota bacterium]
MVMNVEPVKPGTTVPLMNTPPSSQGGGSFASELVSVLIPKKTVKKDTDNNTKEKKDLSGNLLESLKLFSDMEVKLRKIQDVPGQSDPASLKELASLLSEIKQTLMAGIKSSVHNLEQALQDEQENMPPELFEKFKNEITHIKDKFNTGLGLELDSFTPSSNPKPLDELLEILFQKKSALPKALIDKLETL